jgi:hypothetical protein
MNRFRLAIALAAVLLAGCTKAAWVDQPLTRQIKGDDAMSEIRYWHTLADRPVTCNDEAFHGLLMYLDGDDPAKDYPARVTTLKSRGMLPANFDRPANEAVSRGTLAVALVKVLNIKGGATMQLFGPTPRYATRELEFEGVYPPSSPNQTFSGAQFLGIIGKVEDYQRGNPADYSATVMPSQVEAAKTQPAQ